jgi:hypothetical protein
LRRAGLVAFAEYTTGGTDLDDVGAILDDFADFFASRPRAIGNAFGFVVIFRRV